MKSNLCIGTAQFGLNYGVTNKLGQVSKKEVSNILKIAEKNGINYLQIFTAFHSS